MPTKEWRRKNPAKDKAQRDRWRAKHRDKRQAQHKRWRERYPDKRLHFAKLDAYRRRAWLAATGKHTLAEWEATKARWNNCCAACGMQEPFVGQWYPYLTEDHILPVSQGGSNDIDNIQPLCFNCNSKLGAKVERRDNRSNQTSNT